MEEVEYIDCYSKSLQSIIDKYINSDKYGKFTPIISEIFQRFAYYFEYNDSEMENKIVNFTNNVKDIQFISEKALRKSVNNVTVGSYSIADKIIILNLDSIHMKRKLLDYFNRNQIFKDRVMDEENIDRVIAIEVYNILAHEIYHAISKNGKNFGLLEYDINNTKRNGIALNEIITEVASSTTSLNVNEYCFINNKKPTYGYDKITFFTRMLSDVIGVSEKEILKAGIKGREHFDNLIYSQFPEENHDDVYTMMNNIENVILTMLYSTEHGVDVSGSRVDRLKADAYTALVQLMVDLGYMQMSNLPNTVQARKQKIYRLNALVTIIKNVQEENSEILDELDNSIFEVIKNDLINTRDEEAKLDDPNIPNNYEEMIKEEDFLGLRKWNNKPVEEMVLEAIQENENHKIKYYFHSIIFGAKRVLYDTKNMIVYGISDSFEKLHIFFQEIKNSHHLKITDGSDKKISDSEETFDEKYKVTSPKSNNGLNNAKVLKINEQEKADNSQIGIDDDL